MYFKNRTADAKQHSNTIFPLHVQMFLPRESLLTGQNPGSVQNRNKKQQHKQKPKALRINNGEHILRDGQIEPNHLRPKRQSASSLRKKRKRQKHKHTYKRNRNTSITHSFHTSITEFFQTAKKRNIQNRSISRTWTIEYRI